LPRHGVNQRNRISGAIERRDGVERTLLESRAEEAEGRNRVATDQRVLQGNTRRRLQRGARESTPFTNADVELSLPLGLGQFALGLGHVARPMDDML
jgi:hypothetical protein